MVLSLDCLAERQLLAQALPHLAKFVQRDALPQRVTILRLDALSPLPVAAEMVLLNTRVFGHSTRTPTRAWKTSLPSEEPDRGGPLGGLFCRKI